jgi:hypothetical protein
MGQRLREIITVMGDPNKLFWCGSVGSGLAGKISNNYISCSVLLLIAEAMAIGVKSGVDPKMLQKIIHNSTGQTFMGDNVCPVPDVVPHAPSSNNWRLGFKTQMFLKDLSLGIEAARQQDLQPTMAEAAYRVFEKASKDPRCIVRTICRILDVQHTDHRFHRTGTDLLCTYISPIQGRELRVEKEMNDNFRLKEPETRRGNMRQNVGL